MNTIKETIINQMKEKNGNLIIMTDFELGACIDKAIEMYRKENAVDPFGFIEEIRDLFADYNFGELKEETIISHIANSGKMRGLLECLLDTLVGNKTITTNGFIGNPQTRYSLSSELKKQYLIEKFEEIEAEFEEE